MVIRDLGGRGISVQDATWYTEKNGRHGGHMVILGRGIVNYIIIVIVGVVIGALLRSSRKHDAQAVDKHEVRENPLLLVLAFPVLVICAVLAWGLDSQSAGIGWTVVVAILSLPPPSRWPLPSSTDESPTTTRVLPPVTSCDAPGASHMATSRARSREATP